MGGRLSKEPPTLESRAACMRSMWEVKTTRKDLAAPQGFEPRYPAPEAGVLPLNEGALGLLSNERWRRSNAVGAAKQSSSARRTAEGGCPHMITCLYSRVIIYR